MQALLTSLVAATSTTLAADTHANSNVLANVNAQGNLYLGLPVVGPGIPPLSIVTNLSPLTLSQPATANASQASLQNGILFSSRRLIPWDDCKEQPALFVRDTDEETEYSQIIFQRLTIGAEIWLYSNLGQNPDLAPVIGLNYLLDAVQAAMASDDPMQQRYTIGGLVFWCRISGQIKKDPGDLDGQAIAVIPVEIIVP